MTSPYQRLPPRVPKSFSEFQSWNRVVVVLDGCNFAVYKNTDAVANGGPAVHELVDSERHRHYIRQTLKQDFAMFRPDVVHQCVLQLLDSPLNLSGRLEVFLRMANDNNALLRLHPQLRCPVHFDEFCLMIVEALHSYKVRSENTRDSHTAPVSLVRVVRSPFFEHLPASGANVTIFSPSAETKIGNLAEWVQERLQTEREEGASSTAMKPEAVQMSNQRTANETTHVYVIGGFAKGTLDIEGLEKENTNFGIPMQQVAIHADSLTGAMCCAMLSDAYERALNL